MTPAEADEWGLGVLYGTVRLVPTSPAWRAVATRLIDDVRTVLGPDAMDVEHIGSTAVSGMLAKPIIDIGIRLAVGAQTEGVVGALEAVGYEYRGDAGGDGGLVFVMDVRPRVLSPTCMPSLTAIRNGTGTSPSSSGCGPTRPPAPTTRTSSAASPRRTRTVDGHTRRGSARSSSASSNS